MLAVLRIKLPRQAQRVCNFVVKAKPHPPGFLADKAGIKTGVVRNHGGAAAKFQKFRQHLFNHRLIGHHVVADSGQLRNVGRNRPSGIDQLRKGLCPFAVYDFHGADFGDFVPFGAESRGLDIKHDIGLFFAKGGKIADGRIGIVDQIALYPVEYLDFLTAFADGTGRLVCVRKSLCHAVIRNGNRLVSPLGGALDQVAGRGHRVHRAHLGVQMQFHPLFFGVILPFRQRL